MTYRELLELEMLKEGSTKSQAGSKAVDYVVAVLAREQGLVKDLYIEQKIKEGTEAMIRLTLDSKRKELEEIECTLRHRQRAVDERYSKASVMRSEAERMIEANEAIREEIAKFETPRMRDAYRMYCIFQEDNEDLCKSKENTSMYLKSLGDIFRLKPAEEEV